MIPVRKEHLLKYRFTHFAEIEEKLKTLKAQNIGFIVRGELRDNVVMFYRLIYGFSCDVTDNLPEEIRGQLRAINDYIFEAIARKDQPVKVEEDFETPWKYFVYTSTTDSVYGVYFDGSDKDKVDIYELGTDFVSCCHEDINEALYHLGNYHII